MSNHIPDTTAKEKEASSDKIHISVLVAVIKSIDMETHHTFVNQDIEELKLLVEGGLPIEAVAWKCATKMIQSGKWEYPPAGTEFFLVDSFGRVLSGSIRNAAKLVNGPLILACRTYPVSELISLIWDNRSPDKMAELVAQLIKSQKPKETK